MLEEVHGTPQHFNFDGEMYSSNVPQECSWSLAELRSTYLQVLYSEIAPWQVRRVLRAGIAGMGGPKGIYS